MDMSARKISGTKDFGMKHFDRDLTRGEEIVNTVTHAVGAFVSVGGLVALLVKVAGQGDAIATVGAAIFGVALIFMYAASSLYHASCAVYGEYKPSRLRDFLQKCDHSMIFFLIIGTYIPVCWSAIGGWIGWTVFGIVGACCVLGVILNLIDVQRYHKVCLVLNLVTGWAIVAAALPCYNGIGPIGFNFLVAGGIFYTVGVLFYRMQNVYGMHAIWHLFVIGGSLMHYLMIYFYCYV